MIKPEFDECMNILEFKNLSIKYQNEKSAVDNVSFYVPEGSIVAIVGESGSGKSTIIRAAIGLLPQGGKVESGEILFSGNNLLDLSEDELRRMRGNQISMVFQDTGSYLNPRIKIGKQYLELLKIHMEDYSKDKAYDLAVNMLSKMKLPDPKNVMKSYRCIYIFNISVRFSSFIYNNGISRKTGLIYEIS